MSPLLAFIAGLLLGGGLLALVFVATLLASLYRERREQQRFVRSAPIAWSQVQAQRQAGREGWQ